MTNEYLAHLAAERRLALLQILAKSPAYTGNESVLHVGLARYGIPSSRDQVRGDIEWLGEQGLAAVEVMEELRVATITMRGQDVAAGLASVPGVKRPSPRG